MADSARRQPQNRLPSSVRHWEPTPRCVCVCVCVCLFVCVRTCVCVCVCARARVQSPPPLPPPTCQKAQDVLTSALTDTCTLTLAAAQVLVVGEGCATAACVIAASAPSAPKANITFLARVPQARAQACIAAKLNDRVSSMPGLHITGECIAYVLHCLSMVVQVTRLVVSMYFRMVLGAAMDHTNVPTKPALVHTTSVLRHVRELECAPRTPHADNLSTCLACEHGHCVYATLEGLEQFLVSRLSSYACRGGGGHGLP
jgi:hypothetical protein